MIRVLSRQTLPLGLIVAMIVLNTAFVGCSGWAEAAIPVPQRQLGPASNTLNDVTRQNSPCDTPVTMSCYEVTPTHAALDERERGSDEGGLIRVRRSPHNSAAQ